MIMYSSDEYEIYRLASTGANETILFLVRCDEFSANDESHRLLNWWAIQSSDILRNFRIIGNVDFLAKTICAVMELNGNYLGDTNLTGAKETKLTGIFQSMLALIDRGIHSQFYPNFDPSVMWLAVENSNICSLLPLGGPPPPEIDQVWLVARDFLRIVTGIELNRQSKTIPDLNRWSKFGSARLSEIIRVCLGTDRSNSAITTLANLSRILDRPIFVDLDNKDNSLIIERAGSWSVPGRGLDKVAGMHLLKELLRNDVVDPIRNPEPYQRYGISIPNGILLYGPPGCGKTYIARQLAEELGHYFVEIIPSELASPYVHQSVRMIREVFDAAALKAPAIIFIDEFEALAPQRKELGGPQQYKAEEVNELLAHLNMCSERGILVIAATNQPDKIDPAVLRTGRIDKIVYVGPPDKEARREMLAFHLGSRPGGNTIDLGSLAESLDGYSASDISFLVDEAARDAMRSAQDITFESFRSAMARVQPSVTAEICNQYRVIDQRGF